MKSKKFSILTILLIISFSAMTFLPNGTALAEDTRGVAVPLTKTPHGTILDKTPAYVWTRITGATMYQYQVWKSATKVLDRIADSGSCGAVTCGKTPALTLGFNEYMWRVRAYQTTWSDWSAFKTFTITPPSFNSYFTRSYDGWARKAGANWNLYDGYLYTPGIADQYSSAYYTKGQFTNFDYSARVRSFGDWGPPCIAMRMGNKVGAHSEWYPGYLFCYSNNGEFWVNLVKDNGTYVTLVESKYSDKIIKYGWNILRVVARGNQFWFYINATFVGTSTNSYRSRGFVGVMAYHSTLNVNEEIDVDWAKLTVIETIQ